MTSYLTARGSILLIIALIYGSFILVSASQLLGQLVIAPGQVFCRNFALG